MSKIYLCGITSKEYENIKRLTDPIYEYVDGLIFCVDYNAHQDGTLDLLQTRMGDGEILQRSWDNSHDLQMNVWLRSEKLQPGDWCIFRDSMERFNKDWVKNIRSFCNSLSLQGIRTVYNYNKIFMFQWADHLIFQGNPHFGLIGAQPKSIDLSTMFDENKKEHTWRIRDGEEGGRPFDNKINHEAKYYWVYGRSNHTLLGYEDKLEEYQRAEIIRLHVRDIARVNGFDLTIEGLKEFMAWLEEKDLTFFKNWINSHRVVSNFYRYRILNEDFYEIEKTEKAWKIK